MVYRELAEEVFPTKDFPRAWRYSSNGGPPGCYMSLSKALREMGCRSAYDPITKQWRVFAPEQREVP